MALMEASTEVTKLICQPPLGPPRCVFDCCGMLPTALGHTKTHNIDMCVTLLIFPPVTRWHFDDLKTRIPY